MWRRFLYSFLWSKQQLHPIPLWKGLQKGIFLLWMTNNTEMNSMSICSSEGNGKEKFTFLCHRFLLSINFCVTQDLYSSLWSKKQLHLISFVSRFVKGIHLVWKFNNQQITDWVCLSNWSGAHSSSEGNGKQKGNTQDSPIILCSFWASLSKFLAFSVCVAEPPHPTCTKNGVILVIIFKQTQGTHIDREFACLDGMPIYVISNQMTPSGLVLLM